MARPKSNLSERIVKAAAKRFLHDGVDGASLREIAREAKTNIGMIYYYFPAKDDLFLAVVESQYSHLLKSFEELLNSSEAIELRVCNIYTRLGSMSEAEFDVVRLIVREILVSSDRFRKILDRFGRGHLPLLVATILQGVETQKIRSDIPLGALVLSTLALGIMPQIMRRLVGQTHVNGVHLPTPKELAENMTQVLLHGIAQDH